MNKKFIVRLSDEERAVCQEVVKKLKGSSQKVRRAQILLKADADGPAWTDCRIAEAYNCRVQTIENLRKRLVTEGFASALERQKRQEPPTPPKLDGEGEAKLIAMRLGKPPAGYGRSMESVSITNTNATARPAFSCSPSHCRGSDGRPLARSEPKPTGRLRSLTC
jgi:hypothetical protein